MGEEGRRLGAGPAVYSRREAGDGGHENVSLRCQKWTRSYDGHLVGDGSLILYKDILYTW